MSQTMDKDLRESLSPDAAARREVMLGELVGTMSRLHRRRRRVRRGVYSLAAMALIVGTFRLSQQPGDHDTVVTSVSRPEVPTQPVTQRESIAVELVHTDPTIRERYEATPATTIVRIDDGQLLSTLVEIGRPAGLIRFGERVALSAPVTDDELRGQQENH